MSFIVIGTLNIVVIGTIIILLTSLEYTKTKAKLIDTLLADLY